MGCHGFFLCRLKRLFLVGMVPLWARSIKKCGRQPLYVSFGWFGRKETRLLSKNGEFSVLRLKNSFVCNYWSWAKLFIDVGPLSLIDFFDWLGSKWGWVSFCNPSSSSLSPRGTSCILPLCFGLSFGRLFLLIYNRLLSFTYIYIYIYIYIKLETTLPTTFLSLFANTFANNLKRSLIKLKSQKSFKYSTSPFFRD